MKKLAKICAISAFLSTVPNSYADDLSIQEEDLSSSEMDIIDTKKSQKATADKNNSEGFFGGIKNAWTSRDERKKMKQQIQNELKVRKKEFEQYNLENQNRLGKENWTLLNTITSDAARMIEKQYGGFRSIEEGLHCLEAIRDQRDLLNKQEIRAEDTLIIKGFLTDLKNQCHGKLLEFKKLKKARKIKRVKFKQYYDKTEKVHKLRPETHEVIQQLHQQENWDSSFRAYLHDAIARPFMNCSVQGTSVTMAFYVGTRFGGERFKCSTNLGNRAFFALTNVGYSFGFGIHVSRWKQIYTRQMLNDGQSYYDILKYRVPYDSKGLKWGSFFGTNTSLGWGYDVNQDMTSATHWGQISNDPHSHSLPGKTGFGINSYGIGFNANGGLANFFKVKEIRPDFRELFYRMGLKFGQDTRLYRKFSADTIFDKNGPDLFTMTFKKEVKETPKVKETKVERADSPSLDVEIDDDLSEGNDDVPNLFR